MYRSLMSPAGARDQIVRKAMKSGNVKIQNCGMPVPYKRGRSQIYREVRKVREDDRAFRV